MSDTKLPVVTGHHFQILDASQKGSSWEVRAKLGGVERQILVEGSAENVLQVASALSQRPSQVSSLKERTIFKIKGDAFKGGGISMKLTKINPFISRVFLSNLRGLM